MQLKNTKIVLLILVLISLLFNAKAQESLMPGEYTSTNKKAIKFYEEGKRYYDVRQDKRAEELLLKAIDEDKKFMEPHAILAVLCLEQNRLKDREVHLLAATKIAPRLYVENYFFLAETQFDLDKFEDAKMNYNTFLSFSRINPNEKDEAVFKLKCADFAVEAKKKA